MYVSIRKSDHSFLEDVFIPVRSSAQKDLHWLILHQTHPWDPTHGRGTRGSVIAVSHSMPIFLPNFRCFVLFCVTLPHGSYP